MSHAWFAMRQIVQDKYPHHMPGIRVAAHMQCTPLHRLVAHHACWLAWVHVAHEHASSQGRTRTACAQRYMCYRATGWDCEQMRG